MTATNGVSSNAGWRLLVGLLVPGRLLCCSFLSLSFKPYANDAEGLCPATILLM